MYDTRWRAVLTTVSVIVMCVLVGAASCLQQAEPKQTVESLKAKSPTLKNKVRLRIGVRDNAPLNGFRDPKTGIRSGFDIELAKDMAKELGYPEDRIDWVTVNTVPERISAVQKDLVDIVFAGLSMTKEREELVDFAGPYMLVPQAVMVRKDRTKPLDTLTDLGAPGVRLCTGTGSTSAQALKDKNIKAELVDTNAQCMIGLRSKIYDAYVTDLPILAGFLLGERDTFEIINLTIADTEEKIGVAVPNGDESLRKLIAHFLDRWQKGPRESSPWVRAFDQTIGPALNTKYRSQPLVDNPPEVADFDSKAPQG